MIRNEDPYALKKTDFWMKIFSVDGVDPQLSFGFVLGKSIKLYTCFSCLLDISGGAGVSTTRADHSEHLSTIDI